MALAYAVEYAEWRAQPVESPPLLAGLQRDEAGLLLADAVRRGGGWLSADEVRRLLGMYGVPIHERLAEPGVEMLVGVVNDRQFGPTVVCGAGGALVELLKDVSVRLTPLTCADATSMVRELRSFPLLDGYRGAARCDVAALEDVLVRIAALADDHPSIAELDCNPVIVSASGAIVMDARVRVEQVPRRAPLGARR
jgi:acyl-CoA synthetase (NDP forming)